MASARSDNREKSHSKGSETELRDWVLNQSEHDDSSNSDQDAAPPLQTHSDDEIGHVSPQDQVELGDASKDPSDNLQQPPHDTSSGRELTFQSIEAASAYVELHQVKNIKDDDPKSVSDNASASVHKILNAMAGPYKTSVVSKPKKVLQADADEDWNRWQNGSDWIEMKGKVETSPVDPKVEAHVWRLVVCCTAQHASFEIVLTARIE